MIRKLQYRYHEDREVEVTKEFTFDSCHSLIGYCGDCANMHGHTYKLHVTIKGKLDHTGMVLDFKTINKEVQERILDRLDHKNLNDVLDFNTTAENMVLWIFDTLDEEFKKYSRFDIVEVKLWETPTSFATYRRG